jgi:hypothetical protein
VWLFTKAYGMVFGTSNERCAGQLSANNGYQYSTICRCVAFVFCGVAIAALLLEGGVLFVAMGVRKMNVEYRLRARESRLISRFSLPLESTATRPILLEPYAPIV